MDTFDVAVIGAGVIGHVTAYHLAEKGLTVALIDPDPVSQASYAAAGMLAPVAEVQYQQDDLYPLMNTSGAEWPALVNAVAQRANKTPEQLGYQATETLVVGVDAADRQYLTDLAGTQHQHGMNIETVLPSAARTQEPALNPRLSACMRIPTDHQVDPRVFLAKLVHVLETMEPPVRMIRAAAQSLALDDDGATITLSQSIPDDTTSSGETTPLRAAHVVIANGLGANQLLDAELRATHDLGGPFPLRPVHGDILRIRIPERLRPLLTATVRAVVRGFPVYLVPRADGTMVLGATSREDTLTGPSLGGVYELLRDAQEIVPGVREAELLEVIARARPGTPDDIPLLGKLHPRLTLSTGYHRHGILLAALAGRLGADLATDAPLSAADTAALATMNPHRFDPNRPEHPKDTNSP